MMVRSSTQEEHDRMMEYMNRLDHQPQVGFFCYDAVNNDLFGVLDYPADDLEVSNKELIEWYGILGRELHDKAESQGLFCDPFYSYDNYVTTLRGRVQRADDGSVYVVTGKWINDCPGAKETIFERFHLPEDTVIKFDASQDYLSPKAFLF